MGYSIKVYSLLRKAMNIVTQALGLLYLLERRS